MLLSRPATYAIRALIYLAKQSPGRLSGTREISEREDIPSPFLGKVLLELRRGRLLRSYRGTGGGYELALSPEKINLMMVVRCMAGSELFDSCLLNDRDCNPSRPCALHERWRGIREQFRALLEGSTLAELVEARRSVMQAEGENAVASELSRKPNPSSG